jgi:hypothetical protein
MGRAALGAEGGPSDPGGGTVGDCPPVPPEWSTRRGGARTMEMMLMCHEVSV